MDSTFLPISSNLFFQLFSKFLSIIQELINKSLKDWVKF